MPGKTAKNGPVPPPKSPVHHAKTNGEVKFDPEDPEYVRDLQRPAVIKVCIKFSAKIYLENFICRFKKKFHSNQILVFMKIKKKFYFVKKNFFSERNE